MNKKWAEDYSSEEGSADEADLVSEDEVDEKDVDLSHMSITNSSDVNAKVENPSGLLVQISDINFLSSREDIGGFFEEAGCKIAKFDLLKFQNGKSKGLAVMQLHDADSVRLSLEMNGKEFAGRLLHVKRFDEGFGTKSVARKPEPHHKDRGVNDVRDRSGFPGRGRDRNKLDSGGRGHGVLEFENRTKKHNPIQQKAELARESVAVRPKLILQPRTLPIELSGGKTVAAIFGEGKPHDVTDYEVSCLVFSKYSLIHHSAKKRRIRHRF